MTGPTPTSVDVPNLIETLGGITAVTRMIAAHTAQAVKRKTVAKWVERNRITADNLALVVVAAHVSGQPINILDFILPEKTQ